MVFESQNQVLVVALIFKRTTRYWTGSKHHRGLPISCAVQLRYPELWFSFGVFFGINDKSDRQTSDPPWRRGAPPPEAQGLRLAEREVERQLAEADAGFGMALAVRGWHFFKRYCYLRLKRFGWYFWWLFRGFWWRNQLGFNETIPFFATCSKILRKHPGLVDCWQWYLDDFGWCKCKLCVLAEGSLLVSTDGR